MFHIVWITFLTCAAMQLMFFIITALALYFYKKPTSQTEAEEGVSIVISAKNELKNLKRLLPLLLKQDYSQYEIIIVDDRSQDGTYDFLLHITQEEKKIKMVRVEATPDHINNKKYALTLGIKAAKYDIILLTDADCHPASDKWLPLMASGFKSEKVKFVIGYSQYEKRNSFLNSFILYETIITAVNYLGLGLAFGPYMGVGRNLAYRKSFFLEKNGFGKFRSVVGGDDDLFVNEYAKRKNTKFMLDKDALVYSIPKKRLKDFILQKTRHLSVGKYYKMTDKLLLSLFTISKIGFWATIFPVILTDFRTNYVLEGFIITMVSLLVVLKVLKYKTGDKSGIWMFPFLEIIYVFYYISTGLKALFTKKVRWK